MNGDATGDEERAVDRADHFKGGDIAPRAGQGVAAVGACGRDQHTGAGERLQDLGQQLRRNMVGLGNVLGRLRALGGVLRQIFEGHQAVIRFFGEPEHREVP